MGRGRQWFFLGRGASSGRGLEIGGDKISVERWRRNIYIGEFRPLCICKEQPITAFRQYKPKILHSTVEELERCWSTASPIVAMQRPAGMATMAGWGWLFRTAAETDFHQNHTLHSMLDDQPRQVRHDLGPKVIHVSNPWDMLKYFNFHSEGWSKSTPGWKLWYWNQLLAKRWVLGTI